MKIFALKMEREECAGSAIAAPGNQTKLQWSRRGLSVFTKTPILHVENLLNG